MTKRTASELLNDLEGAAVKAELDSVLALTPEERRRELQAAGFDLETVHAKSDALFASIASAPVTVLRPKRPRLAVVLPVGLALAAAVALVIKAALPEPVPTAIPPDDTPAYRAGAMRADARKSCKEHRWHECLAELDDAKALDPAGDDTPELKELRREIAEGTAHP
jgi:hypothetical protein